jgi:hypothetical protein
MAGSCATCGRGLSLIQRARGRQQCDSCAAETKAAADRAIADYPSALDAVVAAEGESPEAVDRVRSLETAMAAGGLDSTGRKADFYRAYLDRALADEVLTADEEGVIDRVGRALYGAADEGAQLAVLADYRVSLFIAMVNDGRLPVMTSPRMVLKKNEVLHLEEPAALVKEVIHREFQAGSRGVSFRVMKGVSYRVGSSRGKMVEVGRSLQVADEGAICITSQRAVYTGERKTIEMPYAKLLDLNVYNDGIQVHLSGRQNPPMFRVASGPMIAAAINAATQRLL